MAAGDIILSSGATITAEDIPAIAAEVKKELAAESKELSDFEEVTSLSGVSSLPGIQSSGSTSKLVRVAMSLLEGLDGKSVELGATSAEIQWRNVGDASWKTLIALSLIKGDPGENVVLRKSAGNIQWKYTDEADTAYRDLIAVSDLKLLFSDLTAEDKAELTKIPILSEVIATSGDSASGSFSADGVDSEGNPKYVLSLVLEKGDKGEPPVLEIGTVTTGLPTTDASATVTPDGETEDGKPKYKINLTIPRGTPGLDGTGSGNVHVETEGLVVGHKYLFVPGASGSANGSMSDFTDIDLGASLASLTGNSESSAISSAIGGADGLSKIIQAAKDGVGMVLSGTDEDGWTRSARVTCVSYKDNVDSGDMGVVLSCVADGIWGGNGGLCEIAYSSSDSTFSINVLSYFHYSDN